MVRALSTAMDSPNLQVAWRCPIHGQMRAPPSLKGRVLGSVRRSFRGYCVQVNRRCGKPLSLTNGWVNRPAENPDQLRTPTAENQRGLSRQRPGTPPLSHTHPLKSAIRYQKSSPLLMGLTRTMVDADV